MPLITTKTSTAISKEKEEILKAKFGKAIELINKSESWLMIDFQENCHLWFKGEETPSAMIELTFSERLPKAATMLLQRQSPI